MIYVEVNGNKYPAKVAGKVNDSDWNGRSTKAITLEMSHSDAINIFVDDVSWKIINERVVSNVTKDENGKETVTPVEEVLIFDNSEYCMAGDVTDHRDGTITVKMGKPTTEELLAILVEGLGG